MPTTQQMRTMYPEHIVDWPTSSTNPVCDYTGTVRVKFLAGGTQFGSGYVWLRFHKSAVPWARALAAVLHSYNYAFVETAGGSLSCRKITNGSRTSLHAHGVAFDINPSKNRYRVSVGPIQFGRETDMPKAMIEAVEAILTVAGKKVSQWGGRWWNVKDPMHFQPSKCTREDLELGIDVGTVVGWRDYQLWSGLTKEDEMPLLPMELGDGMGDKDWKRSDVAYMQSKVNDAYGTGLVEDGLYGNGTAAAIDANVPGSENAGKFLTGKAMANIDKAILDAEIKRVNIAMGSLSKDIDDTNDTVADHLDNHPTARFKPHNHTTDEGTPI
ncbi:MAG: M15 family metallopeptidase [Pseudomonadota bacterium]|nr:M15 family metallopeptidase [Pseudomonadota bacterium]